MTNQLRLLGVFFAFFLKATLGAGTRHLTILTKRQNYERDRVIFNETGGGLADRIGRIAAPND